MRRAVGQRWAISFADLCLVLLAFFVILHAQSSDPARVTDGMRAAFGGGPLPGVADAGWRAADLFEPGEAVLRPVRLAELTRFARRAGPNAQVVVASGGTDGGTHRLDSWELAAARTAAVARAMRAAGVSEDRVTVSIPAMNGKNAGAGQQIRVTIR